MCLKVKTSDEGGRHMTDVSATSGQKAINPPEEQRYNPIQYPQNYFSKHKENSSKSQFKEPNGAGPPSLTDC